MQFTIACCLLHFRPVDQLYDTGSDRRYKREQKGFVLQPSTEQITKKLQPSVKAELQYINGSIIDFFIHFLYNHQSEDMKGYPR